MDIEKARADLALLLKKYGPPLEYRQEMTARVEASKAYHSHGEHTPTCATYETEHMDICPCEDEWQSHMPGSRQV